jgi:uncharacterized membrane protein YfcA
MLDIFTTQNLPILLALVALLIVAALAHGALGFGFPLISTPIVAMFSDMKTAIFLTLFPNIVINIISIISGGNWRLSIGRYWPVSIYVVIGTVLGSRFLLMADPEPLKILLAVMIVIYLQQASLRKLDWTGLKRHPQCSALIFGLLAGFLAGSVNVALPPLVIYFMALGLEALPMTQILNLCFLVGKLTQAFSLSMAGQIDLQTLVHSVPLTIISAAALMLGIRIRSRINPQRYVTMLRQLLWAMSGVLLIQVGLHYR